MAVVMPAATVFVVGLTVSVSTPHAVTFSVLLLEVCVPALLVADTVNV